MAIPGDAEVLRYADTLSNWGRWGSDDLLGTLNFITDEKRASAARLQRTGRTTSCSRLIDTEAQPNDNFAPPIRFMTATGEGIGDEHRLAPKIGSDDRRTQAAGDFFGMVYHGGRLTHIDALSHVFYEGRAYNDVPAEYVSSRHGATKHDITSVRNGIVTRGILVDAPRFRGVDWLQPTDYVTDEEVVEILASQNVELESGDALLLRTGYGRKLLEQGPDKTSVTGHSGWHASCLPLFHGASVALIAADTSNDVSPSGYPSLAVPIHFVGIAKMGLWLIDNCDLEGVSALCGELGTFEFEFVAAALPFVGLTGGPINPIAIF